MPRNFFLRKFFFDYAITRKAIDDNL